MLSLTKNSVSITKALVLGAILCICVNQATPMSQLPEKLDEKTLSQMKMDPVLLKLILKKSMEEQSSSFLKKVIKHFAYATASTASGATLGYLLRDKTKSVVSMDFAAKCGVSFLATYIALIVLFDYLLAPKDFKAESLELVKKLIEKSEQENRSLKRRSPKKSF